jgi:uridine kinase
MADELAEVLRSRSVSCNRASIDEFHNPGHKIRSINGEWTPESRLAEGLNYAAFRELVLDPLGPCGALRFRPRLFDSFRDEFWPEEWFVAEPSSILVSDAGHGFVPDLLDAWDFRIWIEVSAVVMVQRAVERDPAWAGSRESTRLRYEEFYVPTEALYQSRFRPKQAAHCAIDNNDLANPLILRD